MPRRRACEFVWTAVGVVRIPSLMWLESGGPSGMGGRSLGGLLMQDGREPNWNRHETYEPEPKLDMNRTA